MYRSGIGVWEALLLHYLGKVSGLLVDSMKHENRPRALAKARSP
jgi:hypothetical protein